MQLSAILPEERIVVDPSGRRVTDKASAIRLLAELLAPALHTDAQEVERMLLEREQLQSTAIGEGVAIPHAAMDAIADRAAALVLCPQGVEFDSLDGQPAQIILGVVGPRQATAEHLRVLARVSRLLRSKDTREQLLQAADPHSARELVMRDDHEHQPGSGA
ncbi:MAG TPA: PTS sugar transporter subunit IIA [Polyangiaceae bacterium]|nr:PTS sugar transporter subunit IIA [Polyangiaceae bacterium]